MTRYVCRCPYSCEKDFKKAEQLIGPQKLPITMSLATLRAHVWKGGADVMLYYKSNGKVKIKGEILEGEIDVASSG